jgi:hypothetical protein
LLVNYEGFLIDQLKICAYTQSIEYTHILDIQYENPL